jgi:hypothetical protein
MELIIATLGLKRGKMKGKKNAKSNTEQIKQLKKRLSNE